MYEDNDTIINNYAGGLISANGSGAIATKTSDAQASNRSTINNWGTIQAEWDSIELGQNSTLNNYGKIIVNNTSYSTRASIQLQNDNMELLYLHVNQLSGNISIDICRSEDAIKLLFYGNSFCPPFPDCIKYIGKQTCEK